MSSPTLDLAVREVLRNYPAALVHGEIVSLGNHGGFSGARLWRIQAGAAALCLRAWPPGNPDAERLAAIHRHMQAARAAGVECVPALHRTLGGATWVEHSDRLWEVAGWLPGRADFRERPTAVRLGAALTVLARLHAAWSRTPARGPCPAVRRRLELARKWLDLRRDGWDPFRLADQTIARWAERARGHLDRRVALVPRQLAAWAEREVPLQPCLCDVWHDHVLFAGDAVSGVIDFGGMKTDHAAVDLARLLGSMAGNDLDLWRAGLEAYGQVRPLRADEQALAAVLDETGTVLGAANWLMWLYHDGKRFDDGRAVALRLAELVQRIEAWEK